MPTLNEVIGNRLYTLRKDKGLTQSQVADALNIVQNQLSRIEKGERTCSLQNLIDFARFYNVTADYIIGLSDFSSRDKDVQSICEHTGLSQKAVEVLCGQTIIENQIAEDVATDTGASIENVAAALDARNRFKQYRRSKALSLLLEYDVNNELFDRLLDYFDSDEIKFANSTYEIEQARDGEIDMQEYLSCDQNFGGTVVLRNKKRKTLAYVGSPTFIDAVLLHTVENEINRIRKKYREDNTLPWL